MTTPDGWKLEANALVREFKFKDFTEAFAFMTAAAEVAERMNHHPDWSNVYNTVTVRLSTHDKGGVTELDVELATAMNRLA
jgi:4a-hydroxytetrahydrobiopterin dehydratase